ncbi:TerB family tellurite resistance protein [Vitiosangium sp. GDMCC 1.1324]|uniref:tellurite resistance TerB family protein n=1 Tax=Vitiosangium sp. (strain GDMCC 1.1324) TaxID=2138576 RepID=UPI000D36AEC3|nr:TerB family tellurite resistance protein [Vitiosangium sp. GDMCC 1.1324]PTL81561.1 TerB family tellurite resistance protein [Vitiosangium sp. GDMCC 1.1324]
MARPIAEDDFNIEVLKLMLQLAWSDGQIDQQEVGTILGAARSWGVPELEVATLKKALEGTATPPAPDLALLRDRADEVFEAARALIACDGQLRAAETEMLEELRIILSPSH